MNFYFKNAENELVKSEDDENIFKNTNVVLASWKRNLL